MTHNNMVSVQGVVEEQKAVDMVVDEIIAKYRDNSKAILCLALENSVALTASKARIKEIASQGFFAKALNSVVGKNSKLRDCISDNLVDSQYAAVKMLQKIAEHNLLNLKLTAHIHEKLTNLSLTVNQKDIEALAQLAGIYDQIGMEMVSLEARVSKLEELLLSQD